MLAAFAAACIGLGYELGRLRPVKTLDRFMWRRIMFGPKEGSRPLGWPDLLVWGALHPVEVARTYPKSPFYKAPQPEPPVSLDDIFFHPQESARD